MNIGAFGSKLTSASWEYTPLTLVLCEKDICADLEKLTKRLEYAKGKSPGALEKVEIYETGHVSFSNIMDRVTESGLGRCMDVFFVILTLSRCD